MAFDIDKIPQIRRVTLIKLGETFGSQDTLAQANQTLGAYQEHSAILKPYGYTAAHAEELEGARDGLSNAGVDRESAKGKKKVNGQAYVGAMNQAQTDRLVGRSLLIGLREDIEGDSSAIAVDQDAAAALVQTRVAPDKAEPMAQQLELLAIALKKPDVASRLADQGGPEAASALDGAVIALRKADQEDVGVRGTPVETAMLDLLDGIIVQNVRRARRAAATAARKSGNDAILREFKLDKLYRTRAGGPPAEEQDDTHDEGQPTGG
jgi:hypothetical protein